MTTAFAIGVLLAAAGCGLAFVWWMFSGAAAWIEPDREPTPLPRIEHEDSYDE
jgi:predicted nicotinamide N-methyase